MQILCKYNQEKVKNHKKHCNLSCNKNKNYMNSFINMMLTVNNLQYKLVTIY